MNKERTDHSYDDIIHLPHPTSKIHPRMSMADRAAQFSPFAALTGYDAALKETARLTGERIELDEYEKNALNERLQLIAATLGEGHEVSITYFKPDELKAGGEYVTVTGEIKKIDEYERQIIMSSGQSVPIEEVVGLEGMLFHHLEE